MKKSLVVSNFFACVFFTFLFFLGVHICGGRPPSLSRGPDFLQFIILVLFLTELSSRYQPLR